MVHLKDVSVWFNHYCIGRVKKEFLVHPEAVEFPILLKRSSPSEMMVVDNIQCQRFMLQAEIEDAAYSTHPDRAELGLTLFTVEVNIKVTKELLEEFFRCTGKEPAPQLKYSLVYVSSVA
ncbi:hypothetical protein J3R83DRAFT_3130 [Lanmaoa asiatica]|nr:hypothetical protein J3R83DRAFT_3130 [Lanmaoa asiatica]